MIISSLGGKPTFTGYAEVITMAYILSAFFFHELTLITCVLVWTRARVIGGVERALPAVITI